MSPGRVGAASDASAPPPAALEMSGIAFAYGRRPVLEALSLRVPAGVAFGILGANGAGKTTLIRLVVGLLRPRSGTLSVLGRPPSRDVARETGYMPQLSALYLGLSARENVDFFARMQGLSDRRARRDAVERALRLVELWDRRDDPVSALSGGMRQRVSLATALAHRPRLLVLDEPTVGLDPELRAAFWEHFRSLTADGVSIILSSHTMDDAAHCDRLGFLRDGRLIAEGSPRQLAAGTGRDGATLEEAFLYYVRARHGRNGEA